MKPIFAYLKTAELNKSQIERVRRAGYMPLEVKSLEDFKIVLPIPAHSTNEILNAAMETIKDTHMAGDFGNRVCKIVSKDSLK